MRSSRAALRRTDLKEDRVRSRIRPSRFALVFVALLIALLPAIASAQALVKVNDDVFFRLGIQFQVWGDWQEVTPAGTYAQNLYLRRIRFILAGQVQKDVSFFFQTDNPNLGKAPKALAAGFVVQDAWVEWKIANEFRLDAGLFLVPFCRNCLQSTSSYTTLDITPLAALANAVTQSSGTRDTGFGAKGYLAGDHLEYRAYVFSGARDPGAKNSFRYSGRVQYDFLDTETGYTYSGLNMGKKKIFAVGAGSDNQSTFHAYSADAFFDFPVGTAGSVAGQAAWYHYDGETRFPTLLRQNDYLGELGFYVGPLKLEPFVQYHKIDFSDAVNTNNGQERYQGGLTYFVYGHNFKFTGAFTRLVPKNPSLPCTNEITVQLQAYYF
jgi:Phosphate-selective porin O and P